MKKQYKSVSEVFEETKGKLDGSAVEEHQKWVEYTPGDDQKNIAELEQMNKRLYEIAQEYGSNSQEAYNLLTAYDRIHDGAEEIKRKISDGIYAKAGVLQYESKIECKDLQSEIDRLLGNLEFNKKGVLTSEPSVVRVEYIATEHYDPNDPESWRDSLEHSLFNYLPSGVTTNLTLTGNGARLIVEYPTPI